MSEIHLVNFKNYGECDLRTDAPINCFLGNNGEGKTNLLDAIFYLAFCKSFFNPADSQLIRQGEDFMVLQGKFERDGKEENIYCGLKRGQKKQFKRNKKEYEKLSDHIGLIPLVMISPSDINLINEGSDTRRRFLDLIISQYDKPYLENLIAYNRALSQRNRLLKKFMETRSFDEDSLQMWDEQLIRYGEPVYQARRQFVDDFEPLFEKHYQEISRGRDEAKLQYHSPLEEADFENLLKDYREKDRRLTYSAAGIHKDDLLFTINGLAVKKFASQGQQKTYLLSLKLAQAEFLKEKKNITPILLLDDIYDKLDDHRISSLMQTIQKDWFGQVFITDTSTDRLPALFNKLGADFKYYIIRNGNLEKA